MTNTKETSSPGYAVNELGQKVYYYTEEQYKKLQAENERLKRKPEARCTYCGGSEYK